MSLEYKKLGDVAKFIRGITYKPNDLVENFSEYSTVCMRTANVQTKLKQDDLLSVPLGFVKNKEKFLIEGDLLVSTANSWNLVGKCCWVPKLDYSATAGGFISILRANEELLDKSYLYHWFNSSETQLLARNCGRQTTNISNMDLNRCLDIKIPLPSLSEQRRIASILDKADELRQKRQQAIKKLDQLLQATFNDMFGNPLTNPKNWPVSKLGELTCKIQSGNTPKGGADNYIEEGITFIRSQNVLKNEMSLEDVVYINKKIHSQMKNSSLKHGDLLITKTGRINTENSSLGRAAIYLGEDDSANINGHVYLMRLKEHLNKDFILSIITSDSYYKYIRSVCVGVDKYQLNKDHLENFPIIQPPMEIQNKFADIVKAIKSQKPKFLKQLELQENLFKTLQNQAFSGTL